MQDSIIGINDNRFLFTIMEVAFNTKKQTKITSLYDISY
jgi:hypothetical protein